MNREQIESDVALLSALADPVRLTIIRELAREGGTCACDFTECCTVSQPTISHHLRVLREAGVVSTERHGNRIVYSLSPGLEERLARIGAGLSGLVQVG